MDSISLEPIKLDGGSRYYLSRVSRVFLSSDYRKMLLRTPTVDENCTRNAY
jgi:hypothetical protein